MRPRVAGNGMTTRDVGACLIFVVVTLAFAAPLLSDPGGLLPHDPGDPALNSWIIGQNSRHLPYSEAWMNPAVFHPVAGTMTFSEHLLGLAPITAPITWLVGNPFVAYNIAFLLSFMLSGIATYWLVRDLTGSVAGGIVAGLAFAFNPYRSAQLAHLQVLSVYWMPVALLAMHRYLVGGRPVWLCVTAASIALQAMTNGHFLPFFGVIVAGWLIWHGTHRDTWRRGVILAGACAIGSAVAAASYVPYLPVHAAHGLSRPLAEVEFYSASVEDVLSVSDELWLWRGVLPAGGPERQLFPGLTLCLIIVTGLIQRPAGSPRSPRRRLTLALFGLAAVFFIVVIVSALIGPWHWESPIPGLSVSVTRLQRPLTIASILLALTAATSTTARAWFLRRSVLGFLLGAAFLCWLLALGPRPLAFGEPWLEFAPYRGLMTLPGVAALRVPTRIWTPAMLLLAGAGGVLWSRLMASRQRRSQVALTLLAGAGLVAEAWVHPFLVAEAPPLHYAAPAPSRDAIVVEFPFGAPYEEVAAMLRATTAGQPTVNGYSGHSPAAHRIMRAAFAQCDLSPLQAVSRLGPVAVLADGNRTSPECQASLRALGESAERPGGLLVEISGTAPPAPVAEGRRIRPVVVRPSLNQVEAGAMIDADPATRWHSGRQRAGDNVMIDLGTELVPFAVELSQAEHPEAFPRSLLIEGSTDGITWTPRAEVSGAPAAVEGAWRTPRAVTLIIELSPGPARYLRLTQLRDNDTYEWSIAELAVRVRN